VPRPTGRNSPDPSEQSHHIPAKVPIEGLNKPNEARTTPIPPDGRPRRAPAAARGAGGAAPAAVTFRATSITSGADAGGAAGLAWAERTPPRQAGAWEVSDDMATLTRP